MGGPVETVVARRRLRPRQAAARREALSPGADAGAPVPLQPRVRGMREDRLPRPYPRQAHQRRGRHRRRRGMRRAHRLHRRRRAPDPQGDAANRARPRPTETLRLPLHECAAARQAHRGLRTFAPAHVLHPPRRRPSGATTHRSAGPGFIRKWSRRYGWPGRAGSASPSTRRSSRASRRRRSRNSSTNAATSTSKASPSHPASATNAPPRQDAFLGRHTAMQLFREVFRLGRGRGWRFNHSSLYLDFLAGNRGYQCTPWGNPTRNVFGWQRPCYLLVGEGYAGSWRESDGRHRLGRLWRRPQPEVRELHGALRIRAHRGQRRTLEAVRGVEGRAERPAHRGTAGRGPADPLRSRRGAARVSGAGRERPACRVSAGPGTRAWSRIISLRSRNRRPDR